MSAARPMARSRRVPSCRKHGGRCVRSRDKWDGRHHRAPSHRDVQAAKRRERYNASAAIDAECCRSHEVEFRRDATRRRYQVDDHMRESPRGINEDTDGLSNYETPTGGFDVVEKFHHSASTWLIARGRAVRAARGYSGGRAVSQLGHTGLAASGGARDRPSDLPRGRLPLAFEVVRGSERGAGPSIAFANPSRSLPRSAVGQNVGHPAEWSEASERKTPAGNGPG